MKRTILLSLTLLVLVVFNTTAQNYYLNKTKYDYRSYVPQYGDPYIPAVSGICSLFLPGLGQMLSDEPGRGFAFFGASAGCGVVFLVGYGTVINSAMSGYDLSGGGTIMLLGLAGMLAIDIWSIVDAVNVAKVNNMYYQNLRKTSSMHIEVSPYAEQLSINNQFTTPVGLTMRIKF
jgi:TM2 domain-containing membrane protein YozV